MKQLHNEGKTGTVQIRRKVNLIRTLKYSIPLTVTRIPWDPTQASAHEAAPHMHIRPCPGHRVSAASAQGTHRPSDALVLRDFWTAIKGPGSTFE